MAPADINKVPWQRVPGCVGVWVKELSVTTTHVHALVALEPGAATAGRINTHAHQHLWVLSGRAAVAGRPVNEGTYVHVPPGAAHVIDHVGDAGCTLLQFHLVLPEGS
jgi:glyoxylate utilization-related uncharacterized protein